MEWEGVAHITCTLYDMPKWTEKNIAGEDLVGLKTYMDELKKTIKALKESDNALEPRITDSGEPDDYSRYEIMKSNMMMMEKLY